MNKSLRLFTKFMSENKLVSMSYAKTFSIVKNDLKRIDLLEKEIAELKAKLNSIKELVK